MEKMTAAHKLLPMNTWVEVANQDNGKKAVVRINDRGPFVDGRIIDLSKAAARKLGVLGPGTRPGLHPGPGPTPARRGASAARRPHRGGQAGALYSAGGRLHPGEQRLSPGRQCCAHRHQDVSVVEYNRGDMVFRRVRVGKLDSLGQAEKLKARLRRESHKQAFVVAW